MPIDLDQAAAALDYANDVRAAIADLKDRIHADPSWRTAADVVAGDEGGYPAGRMTVAAVLDAAPGVGPGKVAAICRKVLGPTGSPATTRIAELTDRQRGMIVWRLLLRWRGQRLEVLERIAANPRPYRKERAWLEARRQESAA